MQEVKLGQKNQEKIQEAYKRFLMEAGAVIAVICNQHDLKPEDYQIAPDFSKIIKIEKNVDSELSEVGESQN